MGDTEFTAASSNRRAGHFSKRKDHVELPSVGPAIPAVGNTRPAGPIFSSLNAPVAGHACKSCSHLAQRRKTAVEHQHKQHNVSSISSKDDSIYWRNTSVQELVHVPLVLTEVIDNADQGAALTSLEKLHGPPAPSVWGIRTGDIHHAAVYNRETFGYSNRLSRAVGEQLLQLRRRLLNSASRDGFFDNLAFALVTSISTRFCTPETLEARCAFQKNGAKGVVTTATAKKYSLEIARFLRFAATEHFLKLPAIAGASDHAAVDEAVRACFACVLAPIELSSDASFGGHCIGEYLFLRHLNGGQIQQLPPATMSGVIAALKYFAFLLVTAVWSLNVYIISQEPLAATTSVGSSNHIVPPPISDKSLRISELTANHRRIFFSEHFVIKRLSLMMRAAKKAARSVISASSSIRYLNPNKTSVGLGLIQLSLDTIREMVALCKERAWAGLTEMMEGYEFSAMDRSLMVQAFQRSEITDSTIADGWDAVVPSTMKSPLGQLWTKLVSHVDGSYLCKSEYSDRKWIDFLRMADELKYRLFALLLICGGPPKRTAEIALFRLRRVGGALWDERNCFCEFETLSFSDSYCKTAKLSGEGRYTTHFLPVDVAIIFMTYLAFVRPIERRAAKVIYAQRSNLSLTADSIEATYADLLFVSRGLAMPVAKLNLEFRNISLDFAEELKGPMGVRAYRQCAIGLGNALFEGKSPPTANGYFSHMCAHSQRTHDEAYARPIERTQKRDVSEMASVCGVWHTTIGCLSSLTLATSSVSCSGVTIATIVAAAPAAMVTFTAANASIAADTQSARSRLAINPHDLDLIVQGRHPRWPGPLSAGLGYELLMFEQQAEGTLEYIITLLAELADHALGFLSPAQSESTAQVLLQYVDRQRNVLSVLPTAGRSMFLQRCESSTYILCVCILLCPEPGGKTITWLLPAAREQQLGLPVSTLVVVPFTALRLDLENRLKHPRRGVRCWSYVPSSPVPILDAMTPPPSVVLVSLEDVHEQGLFPEFLAANKKRLFRVVFEEVHTAQTHADFRPRMASLKVFQKSEFVLYGVSATIPAASAVWPTLLDNWKMRQEEWRVVRAPRTVRTNIQFDAVMCDSREHADQTLIEAIRKELVSARTGSPDPLLKRRVRVLVFTLTCETAESVGDVLRTSVLGDLADAILVYHGKLEPSQKQAAVTRFLSSGSDAAVLVGTSGFGTGINEPSVRLVVSYEGCRSLIDFVQESGRAGRDGCISTSLWIEWQSIPVWGGPRTEADADFLTRYAATDSKAECRRYVLGSFCDGKGEDCGSLHRSDNDLQVAFCNRCRNGMAALPNAASSQWSQGCLNLLVLVCLVKPGLLPSLRTQHAVIIHNWWR